MSYQKGSAILAADLNGFLTTTNNVYGVGSSDRGYGQTAITQTAVSAGAVILASHWTHLHDMIVVCANHQGTTITSLPPSGVFTIGLPIIAHEQASPSFNAYELSNLVTNINTNRLNTSLTSLSVTTNVWTVTRGTTWSHSIVAEVSAIWADEDHARYFFNSGGQIRLHGDQPITSAMDSRWHNTLSNGVGTAKFAAHATTNTGTIPGSQAVGFYELTNSYQTIFSDSNVVGAFYYTTEGGRVIIEAKRLNFVGVHGGNGNGVQFRITLAETTAFAATTVSAGTNIAFDNVRATTFLSGITAPTYATVTGF